MHWVLFRSKWVIQSELLKGFELAQNFVWHLQLILEFGSLIKITWTICSTRKSVENAFLNNLSSLLSIAHRSYLTNLHLREELGWKKLADPWTGDRRRRASGFLDGLQPCLLLKLDGCLIQRGSIACTSRSFLHGLHIVCFVYSLSIAISLKQVNNLLLLLAGLLIVV